jgi:1-acyl-sn-glycerol-3-phosphate acyltransferase
MPRSNLWKILQIIARFFGTLLFDFKAYGVKNVPTTGGVLFVTNHQSYLDPVLLAQALPRPVSYMAKSELFENRFFAWFIRSLHAFPIRQGEGDVGALRETIRQLQAGNILNIFPEGSRTETGEIAPLEKGVALVIRKAAVPVVAVAIDGSYEAWPRKDKLFHPHQIRVKYSKPMHLENLKGEEIIRRIETEMKKQLSDLRSMR